MIQCAFLNVESSGLVKHRLKERELSRISPKILTQSTEQNWLGYSAWCINFSGPQRPHVSSSFKALPDPPQQSRHQKNYTTQANISTSATVFNYLTWCLREGIAYWSWNLVMHVNDALLTFTYNFIHISVTGHNSSAQQFIYRQFLKLLSLASPLAFTGIRNP